ncbi:hypothetical protein ANN_26774 [Periplaneta americana]|uniref:Per a allergen n=1 Tax=Periplaneta americana TaxID=6978 RepID=A0ABQ8RZJ7_PERAM|nr:hypothetical protein ANN_26774 [Periplaneta americana]
MDQALRAFRRLGGDEEREIYVARRKLYKDIVFEKKTQWQCNIAEEIRQVAGRGNETEVWRSLNKLRKGPHVGNNISPEAWQSHFQWVYEGGGGNYVV